MKRFGKLHYEEITIPAIPFFRTDEQIEAGEPEVIFMPSRIFLKQFMEDGSAWWDTAKDLPNQPGVWYIAVADSGFIVMAERDASMISLEKHEVIQIDHDGPDTAIRGRRWDGENVLPPDA